MASCSFPKRGAGTMRFGVSGRVWPWPRSRLPIMIRMLRVLHDHPHPLHDSHATRAIEKTLSDALPPHTLMQRAGLAVAQLARAIAPHARQVWVLCGPGNNGGDGLEAAALLQAKGLAVTVTWLGGEARIPPDAAQSLSRARAAGVVFADAPEVPLTARDIAIDALLGIGVASGSDKERMPPARWIETLRALRRGPAPLLNVDIPSGLQADTGNWATGFAPDTDARALQYTLTLLTLKPGLWTAHGQDAAGEVWLDSLGADPQELERTASAWLGGPAPAYKRQHDSHKGSFGDVAVVGGEGLHRRGMGMEGAALMAASAALHGGAGRVLVALLDDAALCVAGVIPELMQRRFDTLELNALTVVCGCGGGEAIKDVLPTVLQEAAQLVLDADALNAVAECPELQSALIARSRRGCITVLTPHPLEAARMLGSSSQAVQADRLKAATALAQRFQCVCVLKGSGTVVADAAGSVPRVNPTGNARLATAGTGDVLAGMVGARLAAGVRAFDAACDAVFEHGRLADHWPTGRVLTAGDLATAKKSRKISL